MSKKLQKTSSPQEELYNQYKNADLYGKLQILAEPRKVNNLRADQQNGSKLYKSLLQSYESNAHFRHFSQKVQNDLKNKIQDTFKSIDHDTKQTDFSQGAQNIMNDILFYDLQLEKQYGSDSTGFFNANVEAFKNLMTLSGKQHTEYLQKLSAESKFFEEFAKRSRTDQQAIASNLTVISNWQKELQSCADKLNDIEISIAAQPNWLNDLYAGLHAARLDALEYFEQLTQNNFNAEDFNTKVQSTQDAIQQTGILAEIDEYCKSNKLEKSSETYNNFASKLQVIKLDELMLNYYYDSCSGFEDRDIAEELEESDLSRSQSNLSQIQNEQNNQESQQQSDQNKSNLQKQNNQENSLQNHNQNQNQQSQILSQSDQLNKSDQKQNQNQQSQIEQQLNQQSNLSQSQNNQNSQEQSQSQIYNIERKHSKENAYVSKKLHFLRQYDLEKYHDAIKNFKNEKDQTLQPKTQEQRVKDAIELLKVISETYENGIFFKQGLDRGPYITLATQVICDNLNTIQEEVAKNELIESISKDFNVILTKMSDYDKTNSTSGFDHKKRTNNVKKNIVKFLKAAQCLVPGQQGKLDRVDTSSTLPDANILSHHAELTDEDINKGSDVSSVMAKMKAYFGSVQKYDRVEDVGQDGA